MRLNRIVHTNFLRPSRVNEVSIDRFEAATGDDDTWMPYPVPSHTRPSHMGLYFDKACDLSYIARDISRSMPIARQGTSDANMSKQENYNRLCQWKSTLPEAFKASEKPAPHILLLGFVIPLLLFAITAKSDDFGTECVTMHL